MPVHSICVDPAAAATTAAAQAVKHPVTGRETAHDWQGEYAVLAAKSGNTLVLQMLFDQGYKLRWQTVQVRGTVSPASSLSVPCATGQVNCLDFLPCEFAAVACLSLTPRSSPVIVLRHSTHLSPLPPPHPVACRT
jgi:hypothetical protein